MKSTPELEKELLEKENKILIAMRNKWVKQGFLRGTLYSFIVAISSLLILYGGYIIQLHFFLFMLSGLFFLIGGFQGSTKTSVTLNNLKNLIFHTQTVQDGQKHAEGVASVVYYIIMACTVMLYSIIAYFTWIPFVFSII